jgi:hypothetical protein
VLVFTDNDTTPTKLFCFVLFCVVGWIVPILTYFYQTDADTYQIQLIGIDINIGYSIIILVG